MKPFRIISADVDRKQSAVQSYSLGQNATVTIRVDRTLSPNEVKRVFNELIERVGEGPDVSVSGSKITIKTRDFEPVKTFIEAVNSYSPEWVEEAARDASRAETDLAEAEASLKPLVQYQVNSSGF